MPNSSLLVVKTKASLTLFNNLVRDAWHLISVTGGTKTIAAGVIVIDPSAGEGHYKIATEGGAASDGLETITGGADGDIITLEMATAGQVPTLKNGTGNILLPADIQLNNVTAVIMLRRDGTNWKLVAPPALSLINSKRFCYLTWQDASTIRVGAGEVVLGGLVLLRTVGFAVTFANLDTGAEAAGTNYYVYAVPGATAGRFDAVISVGAGSPTGYSNYKLLGWFHNNGSSAILRYSIGSARADANVDYPEQGPKPGMLQYPGANWMIDIYIASDAGNTGMTIHTGINAAASAYNATPWVSTTYFAQYKACMNAGKRLCTNEEWSMAAFGTPPGANNNTTCWTASANTGSNPTGTLPNCISVLGCTDMTGNVWERVATWSMVTDVAADQSGWAYTNEASTWTGEAEGGEAYTPFGVNAGTDGHQGPRALFRGGGWSNSVDAGGWAVYGGDSPRNVNTALGFRCCS